MKTEKEIRETIKLYQLHLEKAQTQELKQRYEAYIDTFNWVLGD